MNNDLISRDALKKAIKEEICNFELPISANEIMPIIDNAPTVEPFEPDYVGAERLKARQRGYKEGYQNGMEIGKTLNPKIKQGEWIDEYWEDAYEESYHTCSICKKDMRTTHYDNFCPNCGARMRKEKKNDYTKT